MTGEGSGGSLPSSASEYPGASLSEFLQHLINMLVLGGTYALLGIGLTLIFGIMNVVNFTHGVLYTFGAYIMFIVVHQLGINFFLFQTASNGLANALREILQHDLWR